MSFVQAMDALDTVIKKSRVHLYKPIQIAEILYRDRVFGDIDLTNLETYRSRSKSWRDDISIRLLGRICNSSSKFQDDLFNAITPTQIAELGAYNRAHNGAVEAYVYKRFMTKHSQLGDALNYCLNANKDTFQVKTFIDSFWNEPGLKRSLDKIYEIVVYSLFSTLVDTLGLSVEISVNKDKIDILGEFEDFTSKVMRLDYSALSCVQDARVYRVGVTNAADRGLDMYTNWGSAIQIKHLSLDVGLAEDIVNSVSSDKIVIVCKDAEKDVLVSVLTQIGWRSRIQSIVTEADLVKWYEKALRGKFSDEMGNKLISSLCEEIAEEFPSVNSLPEVLSSRHYENIIDDILL